MICSAATLVVLARRNTNGPGETKPVATEVAVSGQRPSEAGPVQMVRFVLFERGIYPREVTVAKGLVNVALEDKTNSTAGLVIEQVTGNERSRVGEIRRAPNHWRGRGMVKLSPGLYEVYDASRPANKALLTVQP